ncbi:hypothetical protein BpHYR1_050580 [Brachionus plicatilis]|uniref:Uncharacterized protein n=1 Tax=Brachionus plicatilis TaxID=10195 RepID=A0A3M7S3B9_BRAPC|nr:hypothetical protein BpHYR1_050580 [Brachionus plicatilis]
MYSLVHSSYNSRGSVRYVLRWSPLRICLSSLVSVSSEGPELCRFLYRLLNTGTESLASILARRTLILSLIFLMASSSSILGLAEQKATVLFYLISELVVLAVDFSCFDEVGLDFFQLKCGRNVGESAHGPRILLVNFVATIAPIVARIFHHFSQHRSYFAHDLLVAPTWPILLTIVALNFHQLGLQLVNVLNFLEHLAFKLFQFRVNHVTFFTYLTKIPSSGLFFESVDIFELGIELLGPGPVPIQLKYVDSKFPYY